MTPQTKFASLCLLPVGDGAGWPPRAPLGPLAMVISALDSPGPHFCKRATPCPWVTLASPPEVCVAFQPAAPHLLGLLPLASCLGK